jgi:aspartate-semialdehyde dehydrogenase
LSKNEEEIVGKRYNVAVVGATGNAGMKTLQILEERNFPVNDIVAVASEKSVGKEVSFRDRKIKVQPLANVDFSRIDLAIFCAGSGVSRKNADAVTAAGCVIIDKSSYFRLNPKVPLIIPEVNADALKNGAPLGIISAPNCITVPLAVTLNALTQLSPLKRVVASTYQSVSGAGRNAVDELYNQTKNLISSGALHSEVFPKQIAFNIIPTIGNLYESGVSDEEDKISCEICKVLKSNVKVAVTCVRVPVFVGHCVAVACEFCEKVENADIQKAFETGKGIVVTDCDATPIDAQGEDAVYVSRIRRDDTVKNGILYWIACDNLRKGAALNSVQIAESVISVDPQLTVFKKNSSAA